MYEFEQNKKNNIILHGVTTKHPETSESLRKRIVDIFRDNLNIRRDVPVTRATRIHTGPDVRGCRPVLVTFETFKGWSYFQTQVFGAKIQTYKCIKNRTLCVL